MFSLIRYQISISTVILPFIYHVDILFYFISCSYFIAQVIIK